MFAVFLTQQQKPLFVKFNVSDPRFSQNMKNNIKTNVHIKKQVNLVITQYN